MSTVWSDTGLVTLHRPGRRTTTLHLDYNTGLFARVSVISRRSTRTAGLSERTREVAGGSGAETAGRDTASRTTEICPDSRPLRRCTPRYRRAGAPRRHPAQPLGLKIPAAGGGGPSVTRVCDSVSGFIRESHRDASICKGESALRTRSDAGASLSLTRVDNHTQEKHQNYHTLSL